MSYKIFFSIDLLFFSGCSSGKFDSVTPSPPFQHGTTYNCFKAMYKLLWKLTGNWSRTSTTGEGDGGGVGRGVATGVGWAVGDRVGARVGIAVGVRVGHGIGATRWVFQSAKSIETNRFRIWKTRAPYATLGFCSNFGYGRRSRSRNPFRLEAFD